MNKNILTDTPDDRGEIVVYQPDEVTRLEVRVSDETVWLTQAQMSELFGRERTVITKHIQIYLLSMNWMKKAMCNFCTLLIQTNLSKPSVWMSLYQWGIALNHFKEHISDSGLIKSLKSICYIVHLYISA